MTTTILIGFATISAIVGVAGTVLESITSRYPHLFAAKIDAETARMRAEYASRWTAEHVTQARPAPASQLDPL